MSKILFCIFISLFCISSVPADTVVLKNGNHIHGRAEHYRPDPGKYQVHFVNGGWILICKTEVVRVEKNDKDDFKDRKQKD